MSVITDLVEHRTKIIAMKTALLSDKNGGCMKASELDKDIKSIDLLIEKAIANQPTEAMKEGGEG